MAAQLGRRGNLHRTNTVPTAPNPPPTTNYPTGGPKGPTGPSAEQKAIDKAAADALARENAAKAASGKRFLDQASNLDAQIAALKYALEHSFGAALDQNLADVNKNLEQQFKILTTGHAARARGFLDTAKDTEIATAGQADSAFGNLIRERQDGMTQILEHGVGETDALRSMVMAARNWQANMGEGNRAYFDSMRSVNNGITDLNLDTKTALANAATTSETERERLWQDFYNRRSDTFTQLGNVYGQQRDYFSQAKEMGQNPATGVEASTKANSESAFMDAAKEAGKSYVQQGIPGEIQNWSGQAQVKAKLQNTNLASAVEFMPVGRAEGASSLRRW